MQDLKVLSQAIKKTNGVIVSNSRSGNFQKTQTGVTVLDSLFGGGILQGSNVLLYGEPICGKKLILMRFIYEGLKSQIPAVLILTDFGYLDWKVKMQNLGMDISPFEKLGNLKIVDCYSKQFEPSLQNLPSVRFADGPSALSSISLQISISQEEILESFPAHRLGFMSLSTLLEETDSKSFYKFIQFQIGKIKKNGATSLFTLEKGMHDSNDVGMLEHLMDGIIEFEDGKIRARGFGAIPEWKEYSITDNGIELH